MKKIKAKAAISKKSDKSPLMEQPGLLDLVSAMAKIAERLENLEKRMDQVVHQISGVPALVSVQKIERTHGGPERRPEHTGSNHPHNHQQNNNRHERLMYKAVCADCRKDCEVPFKPSGDRLIYCKECFAVRNANQQGKNAIELPVRENDPLDELGRAAVATAPALAKTVVKTKPPSPRKNRKENRIIY